MVHRLCNLSKQNSFFLFGARGTGKSTLLKSSHFLKDATYYDLLNPTVDERFALRPSLLAEQCAALKKGSWVVIDEIQKQPKLLDVVHSLIEDYHLNFALTGSSSRKLKRGGGNLLAGRAFVHALFPFTQKELGEEFDLDFALKWGTLPKILEFKNDIDRKRFLRAYTQVYLKEEILIEQLIRNLDPFRLFLPIAAQMNGHIINYSNISRDTGADVKTVQNYYQILVETHLGSFIEPYSKSVRKVQKQSPKFYFFDLGVKWALQHRLGSTLQKRTSEYGEAFETWFINECIRLNSYLETDFQFSYLRTKDDVEIDLIIERPDQSIALVEIKSSDFIDERHVKSLKMFANDFPDADLFCVSRVARAQKMDKIWVLPWAEAFKELGLE